MLKDYRRNVVKKIAEYRDLETFLLDSKCSIYPLYKKEPACKCRLTADKYLRYNPIKVILRLRRYV